MRYLDRRNSVAHMTSFSRPRIERVVSVASSSVLVCCAVLSWQSLAAATEPSVRADHPYIQYTGRVDHEDPTAPTLWWPNSEVAARFEGDSISVRLDDYGDNYFYAIIDDGVPTVLDLKPGIATYTLARGLDDAIHSVRLVKRTETAEGQTAFRGFVFEQGGGLVEPPARLRHRIEFYGDSITAGHSVASTRGDSSAAEAKDSYYAYAAITARNLDAEHHCIAVSAIGLYVDSWGFGGDMQSLYYDRLGPFKKWDFERWKPHLVVVNLGQNDAWGPHTPTGATENYVKFVRTLRGHYPDAHIILALGCMQATDDDSRWPNYLLAAVKTLRDKHDDNRVHGLIFPYSGDSHPSADRQRAMADQLTEFVRKTIPNFN